MAYQADVKSVAGIATYLAAIKASDSCTHSNADNNNNGSTIRMTCKNKENQLHTTVTSEGIQNRLSTSKKLPGLPDTRC